MSFVLPPLMVGNTRLVPKLHQTNLFSVKHSIRLTALKSLVPAKMASAYIHKGSVLRVILHCMIGVKDIRINC